jgi:hypothetical protein
VGAAAERNPFAPIAEHEQRGNPFAPTLARPTSTTRVGGGGGGGSDGWPPTGRSKSTADRLNRRSGSSELGSISFPTGPRRPNGHPTLAAAAARPTTTPPPTAARPPCKNGCGWTAAAAGAACCRLCDSSNMGNHMRGCAKANVRVRRAGGADLPPHDATVPPRTSPGTNPFETGLASQPLPQSTQGCRTADLSTSFMRYSVLVNGEEVDVDTVFDSDSD